MSEEVDASVIKKTQDILGTVIKKPVLSEKSLKKPPFRFLHDIITNVIKTTGFLKGLYTPEELQSDNVKDKESKMGFLQKAIDVLALVTNQPVNLKPSQVVAGKEPQKTNVFLQILGTAAKSKLDSKEAVFKILNRNTQGSPLKAVKDRRASVDKRSKNTSDKAHTRSLTKTLDPVKKPSTSSTQSKEPSKTKDGDLKPKEKTKSKDREKSRDRARLSKTDDHKKGEKVSKERPSHKKGEAVAEGVQATVSNDDLGNDPHESLDNRMPEEENGVPSAGLTNGDLPMVEFQDPDVNKADDQHYNDVIEKPLSEKFHKPHSSRGTRPPSARSKRTKPGDENEAATEASKDSMLSLSNGLMNGHPESSNFENLLLARPPSVRPPSARPSSSRPAPPRIRIRNVVENEEPSIRPVTAKPVENVILDQGHQSEEEEDEAFVLMEDDTNEKMAEPMITNSLPLETPDEDKGSLVKKLLETKKDLEGGSQQSPTKKVEIDKSQMSDTSRNRARETVNREMEQIRTFVQSLSKTAVPLGKMLDYLQEDMDAMKMELKMWRAENEQNLVALRKEQGATESSLEPLRVQLDDLDQVVQNQLDANSALKSSIARNDERIQRMLASVNHKS